MDPCRSGVRSMALLIGLVMGVSVLGCGKPCCPEIERFESDYEYVCSQCPDSDPSLFFRITYLTEAKDGLVPCDAAETGLMRVRNLTSGADVDPASIVASPDERGVYTEPDGGAGVEITDDSTFELRATGDQACGDAAVAEIEIKVVREDTFKRLCFSFNDDLQLWSGNFDSFGPGVVISRVESDAEANEVSINIDFGGTESPLQPGDATDVFAGLSPNGLWRIRIPEDDARKRQAAVGDPCVKVYLACNCQL